MRGSRRGTRISCLVIELLQPGDDCGGDCEQELHDLAGGKAIDGCKLPTPGYGQRLAIDLLDSFSKNTFTDASNVPGNGAYCGTRDTP